MCFHGIRISPPGAAGIPFSTAYTDSSPHTSESAHSISTADDRNAPPCPAAVLEIDHVLFEMRRHAENTVQIIRKETVRIHDGAGPSPPTVCLFYGCSVASLHFVEKPEA